MVLRNAAGCSLVFRPRLGYRLLCDEETGSVGAEHISASCKSYSLLVEQINKMAELNIGLSVG